jgi:hypothetical protein
MAEKMFMNGHGESGGDSINHGAGNTKNKSKRVPSASRRDKNATKYMRKNDYSSDDSDSYHDKKRSRRHHKRKRSRHRSRSRSVERRDDRKKEERRRHRHQRRDDDRKRKKRRHKSRSRSVSSDSSSTSETSLSSHSSSRNLSKRRHCNDRHSRHKRRHRSKSRKKERRKSPKRHRSRSRERSQSVSSSSSSSSAGVDSIKNNSVIPPQHDQSVQHERNEERDNGGTELQMLEMSAYHKRGFFQPPLYSDQPEQDEQLEQDEIIKELEEEAKIKNTPPQTADEIIKELPPARKEETQMKNTPLRFNYCKTVDELIEFAYNNLDVMTTKDATELWQRVSKKISYDGHVQHDNSQPGATEEDSGRKVDAIFQNTIDRLGVFSTTGLIQTIFSMSRIAEALQKQRNSEGESCNERGTVVMTYLTSLLLNRDMKPNEDFFRFFAVKTIDKIKHLDTKDLSDLAYAYAMIRYAPEFDDGSNLFDHIAKEAVAKAEFAAPIELAHIVWACVKVNKSDSELFWTIGDQVVAYHFDEFKPESLSSIVWSFAKSGVQHPELFEKVADHIVDYSDILDRLIPQQLSNISWAYATAGVNHLELFEKVANHIVESEILHRFDPQTLANTVWAYATAQVSHLKLFQKVAEVAIRRQEEFIPQHIPNLLWAYAKMGIVDKQLFSSFESTAAKLVQFYKNQELSNIAWVYAVVDVDAPSLFDDSFIRKCVEKKDGFQHVQLAQLYQWHLWQTEEKCNPGLPRELHEKCHEAFISQDIQPSRLQEDVEAQLVSIGLEPKEEVLMDSGYRIDAVVEVNGKTVGVEVDGPWHFIGDSRSLLGRTILKRRQVPSIDGVELVSVSYWEWRELGKDQEKEQDYLWDLLEGRQRQDDDDKSRSRSMSRGSSSPQEETSLSSSRSTSKDLAKRKHRNDRHKHKRRHKSKGRKKEKKKSSKRHRSRRGS